MGINARLIFATTAIEQTWGRDEDLLFLGEWCKVYSRKEIWQRRSYQTQEFHWSDRTKLARDHDYLKELYERVLRWLTIELNRIHNVNHSERYWRIVIGPWLITYIPVVWTRWEEITRVLDQNKSISTVVPINEVLSPIADGYVQAQKLFFSDEWNYLLCLDIIKTLGSDQVSFEKAPVTLKFDFLNKSKSSFKSKIGNFLDKFVGTFNLKNKYRVVIYDSYFPFLRLISIFLKIRQFPRLFRNLHFYPKTLNPDYEMRRKFGHFGLAGNEFEKFLSSKIPLDLPLAHVESYSNLNDCVVNLPTAKIIFTASPFASESFKIWSATQVSSNAKFVASSHGGALISRFAMFNHEEDISDLKTVWSKPFLDKHIQIAPNKINRNIQTSREKITLIGLELPRYPYRAHSGPTGPLMIKEIEQKFEFVSSLSDNSRKDFVFRPAPSAGWDTRQRFMDKFGKNILSTGNTLIKDYKKSKLIICSYPQTTFSEAMASGVPVILLYVESCWEFISLFADLREVLSSAKVCFSDPKLAAEHVNNISDQPEVWWNSKDVFDARKMFFELCVKKSNNPSSDWANFFNGI